MPAPIKLNRWHRKAPCVDVNAPFVRQHGFSLVEVLIALVVMSVGMLGIAGLYVHSLQAGRTSMLRQHAVTLAGDVAERIRANARAGIAYEGAGQDGRCVAGGIDCDEVAMARHDILLWQQQARATLPGGHVGISFDNSGALPAYTIAVGWSEPAAMAQPGYSVTISVLPNQDPGDDAAH